MKGCAREKKHKVDRWEATSERGECEIWACRDSGVADGNKTRK